jgi:Alternative complex III, ActD subunit
MNKIAGAMGVFTEPGQVLKAANLIKTAGYKKFDFYTPYPIHGLDDAMGIRKTVLPYISLVAGIIGTAMAIHLQWWTGAVDYPLIIGGKPFFAFEPSIPIIFELTVLLSALATAIGMFALNGLPSWSNKYQGDPHFKRMMDDAFVVTIDASDPQFNGDTTKEFLESLGADQVRLVEHHEE